MCAAGSKYFMESRLVPMFHEILYLLDDRVEKKYNFNAKCLLLMSWNMRFSHHIKIVIRSRGK